MPLDPDAPEFVPEEERLAATATSVAETALAGEGRRRKSRKSRSKKTSKKTRSRRHRKRGGSSCSGM